MIDSSDERWGERFEQTEEKDSWIGKKRVLSVRSQEWCFAMEDKMKRERDLQKKLIN